MYLNSSCSSSCPAALRSERVVQRMIPPKKKLKKVAHWPSSSASSFGSEKCVLKKAMSTKISTRKLNIDVLLVLM